MLLGAFLTKENKMAAKDKKEEKKEEVKVEAKVEAKPEKKEVSKKVQEHPGFKRHLFERKYDHLKETDLEPVELDCRVPIKINGELFEGLVIVPRHVANDISNMIYAKNQADILIFTGRNFLVSRAANNALVVREMGSV